MMGNAGGNLRAKVARPRPKKRPRKNKKTPMKADKV